MDQAALTKLRVLSAPEAVRGTPAQPGSLSPFVEADTAGKRAGATTKGQF